MTMLVALDESGRRCVASADVRSCDVACPSCGELLVVRVPRKRVPHFAHPAGKRCDEGVRLRQAARKSARSHRRMVAQAQAAASAGQEDLFDLLVDSAIDSRSLPQG
jgi:hypothetical protein